MLDLILVRAVLVLVFGFAAYFLHPAGTSPWVAAGVGSLAGVVVILFEIRLERVSLKRLIGAAVGSVLGIAGAFLMSLVLSRADAPPLLQVALLLLMAYVGLVVGAKKGDMLNLAALGGIFGGEKSSKKSHKILDTSVIIDGRIADIAETGFLDGVLVIPQFVLRELQLVADSADSMKRNRGRRGLDILQRVQKMAHLNVQIVEEDFPQVREVDMKLIELAKLYDCKVVTNDFNLNKVAQLHGVEVLNINELANSLKPIVLPGEFMRVFILKEGKEYNQGVAYLDDGTMVVVDNARKMISKTIDISVTSVLQTTAGKMIFGKFDERTHPTPAPERHDRPVRKSDPQPMGSLPPEENHDRIVGHMKVAVILPAAGLGTRMGKGAAEKTGTSRKQFMLLEGSPILMHTVGKFVASPRVWEIVVAVRGEDVEWVGEMLAGGFPGSRVRVVEGGNSRQQSVGNALASLDADTDLVAVHDAVRPFIDPETIDKVLDEAAETGAAIVGLPAVDTVKQVSRGTGHVRIRATLPREKLVMAQTPQVFRYDILQRAYEAARADGFIGTDEASLVERLDVEVNVVMGSDRNIKITKPGDMDLAHLFYREEVTRNVQ